MNTPPTKFFVGSAIGVALFTAWIAAAFWMIVLIVPASIVFGAEIGIPVGLAASLGAGVVTLAALYIGHNTVTMFDAGRAIMRERLPSWDQPVGWRGIAAATLVLAAVVWGSTILADRDPDDWDAAIAYVNGMLDDHD